MRRYEGYLRGTASAGRNPPRWLVVAAQLRPDCGRSGAGLRASALERWTARLLTLRGGRCTSSSWHAGATAAAYWRLVESMLVVDSPLWIVSPRALQAWQVLGFWEQLETGNVSISPDSYERERPASADSYGRTAGLLCVADPPTAARFRLGDCAGVCTWVCAGNYGLQPLSAGTDADLECAELAAALTAADAVLAQHRLGTWGITAGAMALAGWRRSYDGPALYVNSGRTGDRLEMAAIAGGVLAARATGESGVTAVGVDARSMYGYIAAHYPQAVGLASRALDGAAAAEVVRDHPLSCLADVDVECEYPQYPCRTPQGVSYPIGRFRAVLCGPELQEAMRAGAVSKIHRCNTYRLGQPIAEYERRVWRARQDCESESLCSAGPLIKRLGVSLIGKLLQRIEHWQECLPGLNDPLWGSWVEYDIVGNPQQYRARAGIVECAAYTDLAPHSIPSIPLWIWSWGRRRLWGWIDAAGRNEVYYADTDGMILSPLGLERLRQRGLVYEGSWGMLRVVAGPCQAVIHGPKHFQLGGRVVHAGRPIAAHGTNCGVTESAWYRLPWDEMHEPGWSGSWVERVR